MKLAGGGGNAALFTFDGAGSHGEVEKIVITVAICARTGATRIYR